MGLGGQAGTRWALGGPWRAQPAAFSQTWAPTHTPLLPGQAEGRLGPSTVVLDHTGGFEGLLLVDDDLLGVSEGGPGPAGDRSASSSAPSPPDTPKPSWKSSSPSLPSTA